MLRILFVVILLVSCSSSKINIADNYKAINNKKIALLPIRDNADLREGRILLIEELLRSALKLKGYQLIDESIVKRICLNNSCSNRENFFNQYDVDSLAELEINSFTRNNFGLGFYNSITATLVFSDQEKKELFKITRSEKEKGGLIFQSGQILQGISEQVKNSGDGAFSLLSEKLVEQLMNSVPKIDSASLDLVPNLLELSSIEETKGGVYRVCARSEAQSIVYLVLNKIKINLPEESKGYFCRKVRINPNVIKNGTVYLEAKTVLSNSLRKDIDLKQDIICKLPEELFLTKQGKLSNWKLDYTCQEIKDKNETSLSCFDQGQKCNVKKFLIYQSDFNFGPFEKVLEISNTENIIPPSKKPFKKYLQIVAVDKTNNFSLPTTIRIK